MNNNLEYYYLASPYSHPEERVRYKRFVEVSEAGFALTKLGLNLFCPITQSHTLNVHSKGNDPLDHDECMRVDYVFLSKAKGLIVYMDSGWAVSTGVGLEIDYAHEHKIPVYMLYPDADLNKFLNEIMGREMRQRKEAVEQLNKIREEFKADDALSEIPFPDRFIGITGVRDPLREQLERMNINEELAVAAHKGASKKGKPSIMNFPWIGLSPEDVGRSMDCIISHKDEPDALLEYLNIYQSYIMWAEGLVLEDVNKVFELGREKHGLRSHLNYDASDIDTLIDALGRHTLKGLGNNDEETGLPHAVHAVANILMIKQIINNLSLLPDEEYDKIGN